MSTEADRYRRIAARFDATVRAADVDSWDRPTPCDGWIARDVVSHLCEWIPGFLASFAGITATPAPAPPTPFAAQDPVGAWSALDATLRSWFADPTVSGRHIDGPLGPTTVAAAIDQFVTTDVLIHTWDLARSVGADDQLDPAEIEGLLTAMEPLDGALRASGHYGARIHVASTAPAQDQLLAFLGRDPDWGR